MNYHNITTCDMKNGEGLRVVLWVAGCEHRCGNCHNPQTWDFNSGIPFTLDTFDEVCNELEKDYHKGITLSGGDPLSTSNREEITKLVETLNTLYPHKDIWCYTGYSFEDVIDLPIMPYIDVLVDGKFNYSNRLKNPTVQFKGDDTQRVIDVKQSLLKGEVVLYDTTNILQN